MSRGIGSADMDMDMDMECPHRRGIVAAGRYVRSRFAGACDRADVNGVPDDWFHGTNTPATRATGQCHARQAFAQILGPETRHTVLGEFVLVGHRRQPA